MADDSQDAAAAAANKLAEQATAKADLSYSYWAAGTAKAGGSTIDPANAPKKLTEEEAAALREQQQRVGSSNGTSTSAWNAAGTFEERDVTEWAKASLKERLAAVAGPKARITSVDAVGGHASIWFIRGKKRAGFEFDLSLSWAVGDGDGDGGAKGSMRLVGASPDDLDDLEPSEVTLSSKGAAGGGDALAEARRLAGPLREALAAWYENELKQR